MPLTDDQANHSKLFRQNEKMLLDLMIDFNPGIVIQMSLDQKLELQRNL